MKFIENRRELYLILLCEIWPMIHQNTTIRYIDETVGVGVFATKFIPKGTITWTRDALDRAFSPAEFDALDKQHQHLVDTYAYRNNLGQYILCWDHCRYMNHSFHPNCISTVYEVELAVRDIHPGDQLTNDYGFLNISEPFRPVAEASRRKVVYPDDLLRYATQWDKLIAGAFSKLLRVEQPLKHLINSQTWERLESNASGQTPIPSIRELYCS